MDDFELNIGEGCIINGPAGSGKTHKLIEQFIKEDNPFVLSFTNKEMYIIRLKEQDEINQTCKTFDSHFCEWNDNNIKNKTVFVDEFSMVPNKFITTLYKLIIFGDPNQCNPVEGGQIYYDYINSILDMI